MLALWEPEETIGQAWHRLVGGVSSQARFPDAAVRLEEVRPRLGILFRALGGPGGVRLVAGGAESSSHRLSLMQRMGLGIEKVPVARSDGATVQLPDRIDAFPERGENEALYEWLAAFFAHAGPAEPHPDDPLRADLHRLRLAHRTTRQALESWPGLAPLHERLCAALLRVRPQRRLPPQEAAVEDTIRALIHGAEPGPDGLALLDAVRDPRLPLDGFRARPGYRPFLPVPLWGEVAERQPAAARSETVPEEGGNGVQGDGKRRRASRREDDQTQRDDPLMLNRFEKILGLAEMVNLNRKTEDDDDEEARRAAEDLDEIALGQHDRKAATRLKVELDLPSDAVDTTPLQAEFAYPEWDWKRRIYHPAHCRVVVERAPTEGEDWQPDEAARRRIRLVRRQFEALRPKRQVFSAQPDGDELDLAALVRSVADRRAGGAGSERVHAQVRNAGRDLAVAILMDVSLSTDAWIEGRRVLDVEKEAVLALSHGLAACGDDHAILSFTSRRRDWVSIRTVKDFDERLGEPVVKRIQALKPGHYTRIGAAVRHAVRQLERRPHHHRLLLLLTDGKPNDIDHYEGRYGIEDTRTAIQEARRAGIRVFGVTVDAQARDYFPYLFGRGAYAIFPQIERLPAALPAIYRQITA